jgi:adenosylhomocysteinase
VATARLEVCDPRQLLDSALFIWLDPVEQMEGSILETRIRDDTLAERWTAGQGPWSRISRPVLHRVGERVSKLDLTGRTIACFQHVSADTPYVLLPLVRAGARVSIAAVNPDSTDDAAAAHLARSGVAVWAWSGMTPAERDEGLARLAAEPAEAVSDMGGELILATARRDVAQPLAALEATTSGIHLLAGVDLPFPVFDWNGIPLKDRIHNRHHVGIQAWPAICDITGLAPYGRTVLVVGFGPVGRGVAIEARTLGAVVSVSEVDPVRSLEALQHGLRVVSLDEGLRTCSIIITATGRDGVIGPDRLRATRSGAILANVGHSNREIDVDWLESQPRETVRRHIDRYTIGDRDLYLLNRGSLVNLAAGAGIAIDELFDPFAAIILLGLSWILVGRADGFQPGLQPYPSDLEREIAELSLAARS